MVNSSRKDILIIGGDSDHNILRLVLRCNQLGLSFRAILVGKSNTPEVTVDIDSAALIVDNERIEAKSVFIRPNVFEYLETKDQNSFYKAEAWFGLFIGWMLANPEVKFFNRRYYHRNAVNKLETLLNAKKYGIPIAKTFFSNSKTLINEKAAEQKWIEKPVEGGAYTRKLVKAPVQNGSENVLIGPVTIQEELVFPELRIFRAGDSSISFKVSSDSLDYRESNNTKLELVETPEKLKKPFMELTESMGLEFAAADFKTHQQTGELHLLEVNSGPMFTGFDRNSDGRLTKSMLDWLIK